MKIWAHRGCSQRYPENTILAFEQAAALTARGLAGIELDIQLTKDGELVVIHDERIDRTTDGIGFVRDYTLSELKRFHIYGGRKEPEEIPTMQEVLDCLAPAMKQGLLLNIELKNSIYPYAGMEEKIIALIAERALADSIVYSSFYAASLEKVRSLLPTAKIGTLDDKVSDCLYKLKGGCGADALHPYGNAMDLPAERLKEYTVRAWFKGHLYPERPTGVRMDLDAVAARGITDVFLNEPEEYL